MANNDKTPTFKQKKFAKAYIENNGNASKAALEAYNTTPQNSKTVGYQELQKKAVKEEIKRILDKNGLDLETLTDYSQQAIKKNLENGKYSQQAGISMLQFMYKLHNVIPANRSLKMSYSKQEIATQKDYKTLSDDLKKLTEVTTKLLQDLE